jgi:hypothetical protein
MRPLALLSLIAAFSGCLYAQSADHRLTFDATAPSVAPRAVPTQLGTNRAPDGSTLTVNSQYLMRNGKPWTPVMGEFHFTRYPEAYWEEEILKMKASGVEVIATYVIWIHHEEVEGQFDWSGQRNLRKFAELCAKHGMLLYPRIGPWAHGEARNGGFPDWVLKKSAVRSNDPVYLAEVQRLYTQIGLQLHGLLWKDGGPVIGIQIENEYAADGPGQGREHLAALKSLAVGSGLDVPLYTVTGWDNAVVPEDLFLPVYGGYPDAPWDASTDALPPAEIYSFRFDSRVAANMGAIGGSAAGSNGHNADLRAEVPFLTAEVGGGIQDTYHRRPLLAAGDVPATIAVMIGSGANLLGYYMFQGGENPDGRLTTLQESQRTGYPTDVPLKSYDFQAPLGEFGQMNATLRELKLDHYFLHDFGAQLAPARVIVPTPHPEGPADTTVLRASARMDGRNGFLFVNNYVREQQMPSWVNTQFEVKVSGGPLLVPATPITVPANSYFYWPLNVDLDGVTLRYATAQPILKFRQGSDSYLFFTEIDGIPAEFAFPVESKSAIHAVSGSLAEENGLLRIRSVQPGLSTAITVEGQGGLVHIVLLSPAEAKNLWRVNFHGHDQLIITEAQVYSDGERLILRQIGKPSFTAALFPAAALIAGRGSSKPANEKQDGLFQCLGWQLPERKLAIATAQTRRFGQAPGPVFGPKASLRQSPVVMAPDESSFDQAAEWNVTVPPSALNGLSDVFLSIHYQGDEARLLAGDRLLTDNFFNGAEWRVGLKRFLTGPSARTFRLQVLPLSSKAPIFFEPGTAPSLGMNGRAGSLQSIEALPEYEMDLHL